MVMGYAEAGAAYDRQLPPEHPQPRCPICGSDTSSKIKYDKYGVIFACDKCESSKNIYECEECYRV